MKNLTPEMIEKAKAAKSAEELLSIAKAGGVAMTAEEAATYFAQLNPKSGEISDDELDAVAGGACNIYVTNEDKAKANVVNMTCPQCGVVGAWTHTGVGMESQQFYSCACGYKMYLSYDDDYTVMHAR